MFTMVMRICLLLVLVMAGTGLHSARAEPSAAAFITAIDLKGVDREVGTAIRRDGQELRPRLLMPLYAGDEIFLRDTGSRIALETEAGAETEVSGAGAPYRIADDSASGGGFWSMLGAVAEAVGGSDGDVVPDNMMTRDTDDVITVPMAVRGANPVVNDGKPVWLAWRGGKSPYRVTISADDAVEMHAGVEVQAFAFALPSTAPRRLKVAIEDAGGRKANVLLKLSDRQPEPPFAVNKAAPSAVLAKAAWLTSIEDGRWSIEAARLLRVEQDANSAAGLLLEQIGNGWKAGAPSGN